ncbi:MAG: sulfurtransferase TusA family protein [Nitrospinae bacterium]|nr:sulfurtransferase TusA family protein [Nitrospinota bacterium]
MKIDSTLDIKGEVCPYTFVRSKLAIEEMEPGQVLEIITDHQPATQNVPRSFENEGHKVLEIAKINDREWRMVVQKKS